MSRCSAGCGVRRWFRPRAIVSRCASGRANVAPGPGAPQGSARCWTAVGAARPARGRWARPATSAMSATRTKACTATSLRTGRASRSACALVSTAHVTLNPIKHCGSRLQAFKRQIPTLQILVGPPRSALILIVSKIVI